MGLKPKIEASLARRRAEREAWTGDCFDCRDTGFLFPGQPCNKCEPGKRVAADLAAAAEQERREKIVQAIGLSTRQSRYTWDTFPTANANARRVVGEWLRDWDGQRGLLLIGDWGVGKTGLLVCALKTIAARYAAEGREAGCIRAITLIDLLRALRAGYDDKSYQATVDAYQSCRLLLIDDIGKEKIADTATWAGEQIFSLINHRYERELPTLATSNLTLAELEPRLGGAITSRLMEMCVVHDWSGAGLKNLRGL